MRRRQFVSLLGGAALVTAGYYQDYIPRAFQVQSRIFRDVLRGISPPGSTGSTARRHWIGPMALRVSAGGSHGMWYPMRIIAASFPKSNTYKSTE
jgi:hypothetical protein